MGTHEAFKAAKLHAEATAPYLRSDSTLTVHKLGHGIWWWDIERISEIAGPTWTYRTDRVIPESLLQPRGDGPRHLKLQEGFEAQYWSDGCLLSSTWRRHPFDDAEWQQFLPRGVPRGGNAMTPLPSAVSMPLKLGNVPRTLRQGSAGVWSQVERAALAIGCAALLTAGALAGRAFAMDGIADARLTELSTASPRAGGAGGKAVLTGPQLARELATMLAEPDALTVTRELHRVLARRNVSVVEFSIEKRSLDVGIRSVPGVPLQSIASDLEASPLFAGVAPEFDNRTGLGRITASVCASGGNREADMDCLRSRARP